MTKSEQPFLPEDHEVPETTSRYTKITEGSVKLRFLAPATIGFQTFGTDPNKKEHKSEPYKGNTHLLDDKAWKYFWAVPVFNYTSQLIECYKFQQNKILTAIKDLTVDEDWGNPLEYDLTIKRQGKTMNDTTYSVIPVPRKPLNPQIQELWAAETWNPTALFEKDGDPFKKTIIL